jgi:transposase
VADYEAGMPLKEIKAKHKVGTNTIYNALRRMGKEPGRKLNEQ